MKAKRKRETAEQRARRIGRGLGFYLLKEIVGWQLYTGDVRLRYATPWEVALWRALARKMGVPVK